MATNGNRRVKWSPEDVKKADKLRNYLLQQGLALNHDNHKAACPALFQCNYTDESLKGMRSVISHRGGKAPKPPKLDRVKEWFDEFARSKSLQHGLHPEDDRHLITHFEQLAVNK